MSEVSLRIRLSSIADTSAVIRALHQTLDAHHRILVDPIVGRLVSPAQCDAMREAFEFAPAPYAQRIRVAFPLRYRFAEDCLAAAYKARIRQYAILCGGLDTFPYRQPAWAREMHIFEVDHPATQQWKRQRLEAAGISPPPNLGYVAIDFERKSPLDALIAAGLDSASLAFVSLLGVSHFMTEASLDMLLAMVRSMAPGTRFLFTFVLPESELPRDEIAAFAMNRAYASASGEPWLTFFKPDQLKVKLAAMGFSKIEHTTKDEMDRRYLRYRHDGVKSFAAEQMMMVTV